MDISACTCQMNLTCILNKGIRELFIRCTRVMWGCWEGTHHYRGHDTKTYQQFWTFWKIQTGIVSVIMTWYELLSARFIFLSTHTHTHTHTHTYSVESALNIYKKERNGDSNHPKMSDLLQFATHNAENIIQDHLNGVWVSTVVNRTLSI